MLLLFSTRPVIYRHRLMLPNRKKSEKQFLKISSEIQQTLNKRHRGGRGTHTTEAKVAKSPCFLSLSPFLSPALVSPPCLLSMSPLLVSSPLFFYLSLYLFTILVSIISFPCLFSLLPFLVSSPCPLSLFPFLVNPLFSSLFFVSFPCLVSLFPLLVTCPYFLSLSHFHFVFPVFSSYFFALSHNFI